jgi:hypothetical protein
MPTRRDPRLFDRTRPLAMARSAQLYAHDVTAGDPLTIVDELTDEKGAVTFDVALRLWLSGVAVYDEDRRPTPVETPEQEVERLVVLEELKGGWYMIRAPWLPDGHEKIKGKAKATARLAEIVAKGDTKGVTVGGDGEGGWYEVSAPWLDVAEKVQGRDEAEARADVLIAEGPPEGWVLLTPEEKAAKAEQEAALSEARAIADREAAEAAERDKQEAAEAERRAEMERLAAGQPKADAATAGTGEAEDGDMFAAAPSRGGWFTITGPGIDEADPVKVQGEVARDAKLLELTTAHALANPPVELQPRELAEGEMLPEGEGGPAGEPIAPGEPLIAAEAPAAEAAAQE